jgi:hypothetical protein
MRRSIRAAAFAAALLAATAASTIAAATAGAAVIYDNVPSPLPGNLPSEAFEATSTSEFGGAVTFAGTARANPKVTVVMSSWGCESGNWYNHTCLTTPGSGFTEPITLNIYNPGASNTEGSPPGTLIASVTQTFTIAYRPSKDDVNCTGSKAGEWYNASSATCFNGLAVPITFDLSNVVLPSAAVISVAYNTSDYGYHPIGYGPPCHATAAGCGYDSLNVGLTAPPSVGSDPLPDGIYQTSSSSGAFCDNSNHSGFVLDSAPGCWTAYQPAIEVQAPVGPPTSKDQCKIGGWQSFDNPPFKNQGDCVSYVATGGR